MANKIAHVPKYLDELMDIVKSYEFFFKANLEDLDITMGELPVLLGIFENEGLNQIDLVRKFHVTEANISKTTKHLLEKDLIIKEVDSENNTKKLLFLTDKGEEICKELIVLYEEWKDNMIVGVSRDDLITFKNVLAKFSENAEQYFK